MHLGWRRKAGIGVRYVLVVTSDIERMEGVYCPFEKRPEAAGLRRGTFLLPLALSDVAALQDIHLSTQ